VREIINTVFAFSLTRNKMLLPDDESELASAESHLERQVIRQITRRIVPFLALLYFVAFLDRINVGFAALTMNRDIGLTPQIFGFGAGVFFFGYFLFEVPSTIILRHVGARFWIGRVLITWGVASAGMAFTAGPKSFYILRFLLGLAEAGFFPGIILYLGYWFPARHRSQVIALFMAAAPIAGFIGSPLSGALMQMHGMMGLKGWQWLFLLEGLPAVVLGFATFWILTDRPEQATWLTDEQRTWLSHTMNEEHAQRGSHELVHSPWRALGDWKVLALALAYFGTSAGLYTVGIWSPLMIKAFGVSTMKLSFLVAIPNLIAAVGMLLWSQNSDRTGERYYHAAIACLVGALGMAIAAWTGGSIYLAILGLSLTAFGVSAAKPPLWTLPTKFFAGDGAAASIGLINSLGTLGGFAGPYMIGATAKSGRDFTQGLYFVGGSLVISAITIVALRFVVEKRSSIIFSNGAI